MDTPGKTNSTFITTEQETVVLEPPPPTEDEPLVIPLPEREKEIAQLKGLIANNEMEANEDYLDSDSGNVFPQIVLLKVFDHLDGESLLNCRLVSKSMKSAIDNSSKLMRRLCFSISGIHQFLDSTISTKVRNICLRRALKGSEEGLGSFFEAVGESVESVTIDFLQRPHRCPIFTKASHQSEADSLRRLLTSCKKMDTLTIASSNRAFLQYLDIKDDEKFSNINSFVLNVQGITQEDITWLKAFLLTLSSLHSIEFYLETKVEVLDPMADDQLRLLILQHVRKYPGILNAVITNEALTPKTSNLLLMSVVIRGQKIDFGRTHFDLNHFVGKMQSFPANSLTNANYTSLKRGILHISILKPLTEANRKMIHQFSFLEHLQITFDIAASSNLQFLRWLARLRSLVLRSRSTTPPLPPNSIAFGLNKLKILALHGNLFWSAEVAYSSFHLWFPNLRTLQLNSVGDLPLDFLSFLSKMVLTKVILENCSISDRAFIRPCEIVKDGSPEKKLIVPAIAALKHVIQLKLLNCPSLSDICLSSGIQHCSTLKYLTLQSSGDQINQFTELGLRAISDAGHLKLQQDLIWENMRTINFIPS